MTFNLSDVLAIIGACAIVFGAIAYFCGYRDGAADTRLRIVRRKAQR